MSLIPFSRYHFFDDPFFFRRLDFLDPWYDFEMFPWFPPTASRYQRLKQRERYSYTSTTTTNNSRALGSTSQISSSEPFRSSTSIDEFSSNANQRSLEDANRRTSYITSNNLLAVEIPIQSSASDRRLQQANDSRQSLSQFGRQRGRSFGGIDFYDDVELQPRVIDRGSNQKQLEFSVDMKNFRPEEINVSVKNNRLIIQGERRQEEANRSERSSFFKSTTLPPGTRVDQLQSRLNDDGQLKIEAPLA